MMGIKQSNYTSPTFQCNCSLVVLFVVVWSMLAHFGGVLNADFTAQWVSAHASSQEKKDVNLPIHHEQSLPINGEWAEEENDDSDPKKLFLHLLRSSFTALFSHQFASATQPLVALVSPQQNVPIYVLFVCRKTSPSDSFPNG
jgi:hypothetical protein